MKQLVKKIPLIQVLRIRPFFWLWSAQLLTFIASNMLLFVLGVFVYSKTMSNSHMSLLYLAIGLPATGFGLVSGLLVDRFDKRKILFASSLVRAGILLLLFGKSDNLFLLLSTAALFSVFSQFFVPAEASLIPRIVPENLLFAANSLFSLTFYASIIGGFVLGGPVYEFLGRQAIILAFVLAFGLAGGLTLMIPGHPDPGATRKKITLSGLLDDLKFVLNFIRETSFVGRALLLTTVIQVVITIFMILGPGFADKILFIKLTDASVVLLGPAAAGMILGALSMGIVGHKVSKRTLIFSGVLISGILLLTLSSYIKITQIQNWGLEFSAYVSRLQSSLLPLTVITMFLLGVCVSLIDVSCNTILQERTSDAVRGRVYGMLSTLISGVSLLPVALSGILADIVGIEKIIFGLGLLLLGFGVYIGKKYPTS